MKVTYKQDVTGNGIEVVPTVANRFAIYRDGDQIATVIGEENAMLMAAAPELLAFVKNVSLICRLTKQGRSDGFDIPELHEMAKEVIAKATGGES